MKRILALVFMCGAGSCVVGSAIDADAAKTTKPLSPAAKAKAEAIYEAKLKAEAPADEYFGPLKLSIIGISNSIHDIGLRYDFNHDIPKPTFASAELTESSIRDWEHKYPHDPQLPRNVFFLQRLYTKILLQESRDHAAAIAKLLFSDFPSSPQAKQLKKTLALEHLAPLPTPSPTLEPTATPVPTDTPAAIPSAAASGEIAPNPAVIPSGAITPVPAGTPGTNASALPATPLPVASGAPVPAPSPTPTASTPEPAPTSGAQPAFPTAPPTTPAPAPVATVPSVPTPLPSLAAPTANPSGTPKA